MTDLRTISASDLRAAMLRRAMLRLVRLKGRFRGQVLARLAHAIGRVSRHVPMIDGRRVFFGILSVPLNSMADLGTGQAGGGGGGSGIL